MEKNSISSLAIIGLITILLTGTIVIGAQMMPAFGFGFGNGMYGNGMHGNGMMMHGDHDDHDYECDMDDIHSEEECEEYYDNYSETGLNSYSDHEFEECEEHMHEHMDSYGC